MDVWEGQLPQLAVEGMGLSLSQGTGLLCGEQLKGKDDPKESKRICKTLH